MILEKLSTEGPALGTADFNGDGLKDFYVGGARGQSGAIYYQLRDGGFSEFVSESFQKDEAFEDIDVGILDVENDGDLDLYVVSGGGDMAENSPFLMDRIYLNENDDFKRMDVLLPATNGATVAVSDFNGNGFSDIFVGSRSVPGEYGIDPESFLIENVEGKSFQIKNKLPLGMVTDAIFMDIDNNSSDELLLCGDWMGIKIYELNSEGKLLDVSVQKGLDGTNGFWNVIHPFDLNGDGLLDILAGNQGLNSILKASAAHPLRVYLDDFDGNGQLDPIVFYWKNNVNIPFASKDMLVGQLPTLKKQFLSYHEFSKVNSIQGLTNKKVENIYLVKEITELRSGVFMNRGGVFVFIPFPDKAQFSPIQSFEVFDMNGDLLKDVIYVGNFFGSVNAVGKFDSSPGGILVNKKGRLGASGLSIPLPFDNEYREIIEINDNKLIVMPNNANVMVWEVSKK